MEEYDISLQFKFICTCRQLCNFLPHCIFVLGMRLHDLGPVLQHHLDQLNSVEPDQVEQFRLEIV